MYTKFFSKLVQAITMLPIIIQGIEGIFKSGKGEDKKDKALEIFNLAAGVTEAIAQKDIVDQEKFSEGARELNDALVKIFNASLWHRSKVPTPTP